MKTVRLSAGEWLVGRVGIAESFMDRLLGIRHRAAVDGVLMPTTLLHTFGLKAPMIAVSLDAGQRVVEIRHVPPNRLLWFRDARSVVELAEWIAPPEVGDFVEVRYV